MSKEHQNKYIFKDIENILGYNTNLKSSTWNYHIIGDNGRHELSGQEEKIKSTLTNPQYVTSNLVGSSTRYNFWRSTRLSTTNSLMHLKVVTEMLDSDTHDVVTIIPMSRAKFKEGEEILYDHDNSE